MITSNQQDASQFLTVDEVAQQYRVAPETVYNWIKVGKLKAYKVGGLIRIKPEESANIVTRMN